MEGQDVVGMVGKNDAGGSSRARRRWVAWEWGFTAGSDQGKWLMRLWIPVRKGGILTLEFSFCSGKSPLGEFHVHRESS